jgi:hypothetical protein
MADQANTIEALYYKIRAGNPNHPALRALFPQLDLAAQRRVQVLEKGTVNKEADKMHDVSFDPQSRRQSSMLQQSNAHKTMMDKSSVDL